jgi:hypothetical protein
VSSRAERLLPNRLRALGHWGPDPTTLQEVTMKAVLSLALMLAIAGPVQAQERPADQPDRPVQAQQVEVQVQAERAAPAADVKISREEAQRIIYAQPVADVALVQDPPRNWWWLIGAIVVAGVILGVVLR